MWNVWAIKVEFAPTKLQVKVVFQKLGKQKTQPSSEESPALCCTGEPTEQS